jgi:hypothetical protein
MRVSSRRESHAHCTGKIQVVNRLKIIQLKMTYVYRRTRQLLKCIGDEVQEDSGEWDLDL